MIENTAMAARPRDRMWAGVVAGGVLVAALGAGAGWLMRGRAPNDGASSPPPTAALSTAPAAPIAALPAPTAAPPAVETTPQTPPPAVVATAPPPVTVAPTVRHKPTPVHTQPAPTYSQAPVESAPVYQRAPLDTRPVVASCVGCGTIEGVRAVERKGEGSGVGAVAGGVLGAVVGNQVGGGNGRKAMTVLGALGGGLAGHEIEKRRNSDTVYEVRVRFDDGTTRTLTQRNAPTPGARVVVEGSTLRYLRAGDQGA